MNHNIEELKAKLQAKQKQNKQQLSNLLEAKKLELEIAKLDSSYFTKQSLIQRDINNLNSIVLLIEEKQSKHSKKLRRTFGLGEIPSLILTIASNILYSKLEDREELLLASQLPSSLIESLVESVGRTSYFNPKDLQVEPAIDYDLAELKDAIKLAYMSMGLVSEPDLSKINETNFERRFKAARLQAEEVMANTIKYMSEEEVIKYN